ncbi:MAG: hypothetical protein BGO96_13460 [Micrococcales bacterium 73-15]|nr:MAG: hypothetical protein BGO96_13460 [Micrococcales bacterium 73-15]
MFSHVGRVPTVENEVRPLAVLSLVAAALVAAALAAVPAPRRPRLRPPRPGWRSTTPHRATLTP